MFFPDRRYASKATCPALPPIRGLSFVLGDISFWLGFGLYLGILLAPCGFRRAYCGPHCGRESERVLASLLGSSPSGVRHLSRVLFLSLGLSRSRSPIPSLAPSWWSPCPLMRWAFLPLYGYVLSVPSAFLCIGLICRSRSQYRSSRAVSSLTVSVLCVRLLLRRGVSPCVGFRRSPWGSRWLHLYRLTPDLVSLRDFAIRHMELRSVLHATHSYLMKSGDERRLHFAIPVVWA